MYLDNKTFINNHFVRTGYVDVDTSFDYTCQKKFLHSPTTIFNCECHKNINFNPRSPWGERPDGFHRPNYTQSDFNPRSPWGERLSVIFFAAFCAKFQSTLSVRRATIDLKKEIAFLMPFQSTLSVRRATDNPSKVKIRTRFQSTLSVRRATTCLILLTVDF